MRGLVGIERERERDRGSAWEDDKRERGRQVSWKELRDRRLSLEKSLVGNLASLSWNWFA